MSEKKETIFKVKTDVYPLEAIYGASYSFIDKYYVFLDSSGDGDISIRLKSKEGNEASSVVSEGEFMNELLNYALRVSLSNENKQIRQYIVEQAIFSAVSKDGDSQIEEFSFEDDPLGIAVPWEEKYEEKSGEDSAVGEASEVKQN
jgi:His-Xaa-Ser system protein HxsD